MIFVSFPLTACLAALTQLEVVGICQKREEIS